jgi:hypothetical protein
VVSVAVLVAVPVAWSRLSPSGSAGAGGRAPASVPEPGAAAAPRTSSAPPSSPGTASPSRPAGTPQAAKAAQAAPVRLVAPDVGVDAAVDPVGVDDVGLMALPKDARRVGWYRFGVAPGSTVGSAVLAGHRDSRTQGRGILWDLGRAEPGQSLEVTLADGRRLRFEVVAVDRTAKAALALDALFARDGSPLLRVVTCGGDYLRDEGGYQDNIVVTAVPRGPA